VSSTVDTAVDVRPFQIEFSEEDELIYFNEVDRGNHFAAWQEPELFTSEVRAAFKSLR
jgi:hypothetical protein